LGCAGDIHSSNFAGVHCSALEQQVKDISKQVVTLLGEVDTLRGGRRPLQSPSTLLLRDAASAGQLVTASDVVTERLVTFTNIEVCFLCRGHESVLHMF
jgi:hypothetical protein